MDRKSGAVQGLDRESFNPKSEGQAKIKPYSNRFHTTLNLHGDSKTYKVYSGKQGV